MESTDDMLCRVADALSNDDEIERLGKVLRVKLPAIKRHIKTNLKSTDVTAKGTRKMLRKWSKTVHTGEISSRLKTALEEVNLVGIAEMVENRSPTDNPATTGNRMEYLAQSNQRERSPTDNPATTGNRMECLAQSNQGQRSPTDNPATAGNRMEYLPQLNQGERWNVMILSVLMLLIVILFVIAMIIIKFPCLAVKINVVDGAIIAQKDRDLGKLKYVLGLDVPVTKDLKDTNERAKKLIDMWVERHCSSSKAGDACPSLKNCLEEGNLTHIVAKIECKEGYLFRLLSAGVTLEGTVIIVILAIYWAFPEYRPRWLHNCMQFSTKVHQMRASVSIKVCSSANESNVQQLITEISSRFKRVHKVGYFLLPYNSLDSFSFQNKDFDVIILCHSIHNRRFAITDVMDSLYDKFLANAEISLGKEKVCVIVHDFLKENWSEQRYEDEMTAFRVRQPSTFKHSHLAMMVGRLDKEPAELSQDQWKELDDFIDQAEVAGRPHFVIDNYVPTLLIASLMAVLFFVTALIKHKYMER